MLAMGLAPEHVVDLGPFAGMEQVLDRVLGLALVLEMEEVAEQDQGRVVLRGLASVELRGEGSVCGLDTVPSMAPHPAAAPAMVPVPETE